MRDAWLGFGLSLFGIYLVLAWMFASWARPLVVMSVIPFGLVGVIGGHWYWGVPMSMFTVVALIGMSGIIINDSIVLASTIDDYSRNRALGQAIIDAASDRLRPILLTTLTTVLGIAPLLFEKSAQAAFLKPSVITLVYGLSFGMLVVLLVVPAVMAIQADVLLRYGAARRALLRRAAVRWLAVPVAVGMLALFAATVGWVLVTGGFWLPVGAVPPMALAFALFVGGSALLALGGLAAGALGAFRARRQALPGA